MVRPPDGLQGLLGSPGQGGPELARTREAAVEYGFCSSLVDTPPGAAIEYGLDTKAELNRQPGGPASAPTLRGL
jgi:hypothetical protein